MGCHFLLQGIFPTQELNPCIYDSYQQQLAASATIDFDDMINLAEALSRYSASGEVPR